jgi:hypothetical protein
MIGYIYRMSGDFMSILQDLIPEVIPSQKCHMNMNPIINGYRAMDISRSFETYVEHQGHSYILNNTQHNYRCTSSMTGYPTFQSTYDEVPDDGLVMVVCKIGHCGHWTSP